MKEIFVATGNPNKIKEIEEILQIPLGGKIIEIDEVQSMDLAYVSRKKTEEAFRLVRKPIVTDDVAVYIDAWNNFPGPFVKFVYTVMGIPKLLELFKDEKNRRVTVECAVGLHDGESVHVFTGKVSGNLAYEQRGSNGWGFDPIIIPDGQTRTFAQMSNEEKNKISHRGLAFAQLKEFLDSQK